ncbi:hypothetical protein B0H17DRAFT_1152770 [Mycena rosella]|uniref:Uncharacterized protein n=1 Tax=Mycena rosella TaxID=1033263 RepID=A0AAD7BB85_MYCRO|nr:hypothetical protein B0H17DRAFT_1152770 [Mycena rosella]
MSPHHFSVRRVSAVGTTQILMKGGMHDIAYSLQYTPGVRTTHPNTGVLPFSAQSMPGALTPSGIQQQQKKYNPGNAQIQAPASEVGGQSALPTWRVHPRGPRRRMPRHSLTGGNFGPRFFSTKIPNLSGAFSPTKIWAPAERPPIPRSAGASTMLGRRQYDAQWAPVHRSASIASQHPQQRTLHFYVNDHKPQYCHLNPPRQYPRGSPMLAHPFDQGQLILRPTYNPIPSSPSPAPSNNFYAVLALLLGQYHPPRMHPNDLRDSSASARTSCSLQAFSSPQSCVIRATRRTSGHRHRGQRPRTLKASMSNRLPSRRLHISMLQSGTAFAVFVVDASYAGDSAHPLQMLPLQPRLPRRTHLPPCAPRHLTGPHPIHEPHGFPDGARLCWSSRIHAFDAHVWVQLDSSARRRTADAKEYTDTTACTRRRPSPMRLARREVGVHDGFLARARHRRQLFLMREWAASAFRREEQAGGHMFRINAVLTLSASRLCPTAALERPRTSTDARGRGICAWTWAWRVGAVGHWRRAGFDLEVTKRAACMGARGCAVGCAVSGREGAGAASSQTSMSSETETEIQVLAVVAPKKFVHSPYANGPVVDVDGVIDIHSDGAGLASAFVGSCTSYIPSAYTQQLLDPGYCWTPYTSSFPDNSCSKMSWEDGKLGTTQRGHGTASVVDEGLARQLLSRTK